MSEETKKYRPPESREGLLRRYANGERTFSNAELSDAQRKQTQVAFTIGLATVRYFFSASPTNSNRALVPGSSGNPRSALILLWVVSRAPKTRTAMPASFNAWPNRCA